MGAKSAPGQGSTFWFEVPFHTQRPETDSSFEGVRVLLVGIERTVEQDLVSVLRGWHAETATCDVENVSRMMVSAAQAGTPWHVVFVTHLNTSIVELDRTLTNGKRRARVIALESARPIVDRTAILDWPYVAMLRLPVTRERLHRALNFAALDELEAREYARPWQRHHATGKLGARPRVLVAEDNATNRKIIAQILEHGGLDVTLAETGTQAIEALQGAHFDIVILDKHMPGMSGMEVAARYKALRDGDAAPMIMLTAEATAEAMQECKAAGMQAFLTKPIDPEMLFETIGALMGASALSTKDATSARSSVNEEKVSLPEAPLLDEAVLSELDKHAHSPQFIVDVVDSFESDMLDLLERLDVAAKREDWPDIAEIRHAIEGTARGSGATAMVGLIGDLKTLDEAAPSERDRRIARLRTCFIATRKAMEEFLSRRTMELRV